MRRIFREQEVQISGRVELAATDLDGSILAVYIRNMHGECFLVDDTKMGENLLKFVGSWVDVQGSVRTEDFMNILRVLDYSIGA